jgi:hypothetical protein
VNSRDGAIALVFYLIGAVILVLIIGRAVVAAVWLAGLDLTAAQDKGPGDFSPGLCHSLRAGVMPHIWSPLAGDNSWL